MTIPVRGVVGGGNLFGAGASPSVERQVSGDSNAALFKMSAGSGSFGAPGATALAPSSFAAGEPMGQPRIMSQTYPAGVYGRMCYELSCHVSFGITFRIRI